MYNVQTRLEKWDNDKEVKLRERYRPPNWSVTELTDISAMLLSMHPHPPVSVRLWLLSWTSPILGTQLLSLLHMKKFIYLKVIPTVVVVVETSYEGDSFIWVKITGYVSKRSSVSSVRFCRSYKEYKVPWHTIPVLHFVTLVFLIISQGIPLFLAWVLALLLYLCLPTPHGTPSDPTSVGMQSVSASQSPMTQSTRSRIMFHVNEYSVEVDH